MFWGGDEGCEQVAKVSHKLWGVTRRSVDKTEGGTGVKCHELERSFILLLMRIWRKMAMKGS